MAGVEVESLQALDRLLADSSARLNNARLQDLDLTRREPELLARNDFHGTVVLGGRMSRRLEIHLRGHGAVVFRDDPRLPVPAFRNRLYDFTDLYRGLLVRGYSDTPDARAYRWSRDAGIEHDAYVTLQRAIHDDCVTDALHEWVAGRPVVGVMGGHAVQRGTTQFAQAAALGARLADRGLTVATGGGPGAMEAANLGALLGDSPHLAAALAELGESPDFHDDVDGWARAAWLVRTSHVAEHVDRSVGVPTWFYGHEPPNLFGGAIAKYFSNALREDILLSISNAGIVVLPGSAGTVQEIFQAVTPLHYATTPGPPLILVGREQWASTIPVWPVIQSLGGQSTLSSCAHLVDSVDEAAEILIRAITSPS